MDLRRYLLIARHWLWMFLLATIAAAAVAYVVSSHQTKLYRATATLIINQAQVATGPTYSDVLASQQLTKTYASVATSRPVLAAAAKSLGLPASSVSSTCACLMNGRTALLKVSADVPVNTQLITVSGVSSSTKMAADGANAVAAAFTDAIKQSQLGQADSAGQDLNSQIQSVQTSIQKTTSSINALAGTAGASNSAQVAALQSQLSQEQSTYATLVGQLAQIKLAQANVASVVRIVEPAARPSAPFSPRKSLDVGLAAVLGLILAVGLALLLEYLDDRVQTPEDVEMVTSGTATLGIVQKLEAARSGSGVSSQLLLPVDGGFSTTHEAYRLLRSNLEFAAADRPVKTLVVTSAKASEGKSTTAANLAIVLAQTGRRVLLVDADMRRPSLHRLFELPNEAGFSLLFLLTEAVEVAPLISQTQYENLTVMTCGLLPPNPTELLSSPRMRQLVKLLSEKADIVIFDSSPVLAVADAAEVASKVDGVLLVVDSTKTRPSELAQARAALRRASASVLGVVLNKLPRKQSSKSYHYYTYGDYRPYDGDRVVAQKRSTTDTRLAPVANGSHVAIAKPGANGHHREEQ